MTYQGKGWWIFSPKMADPLLIIARHQEKEIWRKQFTVKTIFAAEDYHSGSAELGSKATLV
jgi:hypothetical protein